MKVEVLTISGKVNNQLGYMVNIKSLKNYKKLLKIDQSFYFGGCLVNIAFKEVSIEDLYKYQFPYEHFVLAAKSLEEKLQYKTKNTQTNNVLKEVIENLNKLKISSTLPDSRRTGDYRIGLEAAISEISNFIK